MKQTNFNIESYNKQYQQNQKVVKSLEQLMQDKDFVNYQYHQQIFVKEVLKKYYQLRDEWILIGLVNKKGKLNEDKFKQPIFQYEIESFQNLTNLLAKIQVNLFEADLGTKDYKQLVKNNNIGVDLINHDWILQKLSSELNALLVFKLFDKFYRLVFKLNFKKSYLLVDLDLRKSLSNEADLKNALKQATKLINQGLDQLDVFIGSTVFNENNYESEFNISKMTINFNKQFEQPLVKIYWNWTYGTNVYDCENGDDVTSLLIDEHEPYEECPKANLNCLYHNGIYQGSCLVGTTVNLTLVKNNNYCNKIKNFNVEINHNQFLYWKFPAFYNIINGQAFIIFDPQWLKEQTLIGKTDERCRRLDKHLLKDYLIGIYIGDCESEQEIQLCLDEISSDCKWNDLVQGWDFSNSFDKLEVVALKEDQ